MTLTFVQESKTQSPKQKDLQEMCDEYLKTNNSEIAYRLAENPHCSKTILCKILNHTRDPYLTAAILEHQNIPPTVLKKYCHSSEKVIQRAIVQNPNVTLDIITNFLHTDDYLIQYYIVKYALTHDQPQIWLKFYEKHEWKNYINKYLKQSQSKED